MYKIYPQLYINKHLRHAPFAVNTYTYSYIA